MSKKRKIRVEPFCVLSEKIIEQIVSYHYQYWHTFNPNMKKEDTVYKFCKIYTQTKLPFGLACFDDVDHLIGFCVLKLENLKKYPDIFPWLSDVMILEEYRRRGYGKVFLLEIEKVLKNLGYSRVYVWTDQAPIFYEKCGFSYLQEVEKNEGGYGKLYVKNLL